MSDDTLIPPIVRLATLVNACAASRAVQAVAEIGVADAIGPDETVPIDELARRCACHPDALHRVLRTLEVEGVFRRRGDAWAHTDQSVLLRDDHPTSARAIAWLSGLPLIWGAFGELTESIRTGRPAAFLEADGGVFPYLERHPEQQALFDEAMTSRSYGDVAAIIDHVDFSPYTTIADIGGGTGYLIRTILTRNPTSRAVLFDLPHVIAKTEVLDHERLTLQAGDFFTDPLPSADLTILMQVVHDWDEPRATAILDAVARANAPDSTLMLFELLLPDNPAPNIAWSVDLLMLVGPGGRERTADEYRSLLDRAGYDVISITHTAGLVGTIEARRR